MPGAQSPDAPCGAGEFRATCAVAIPQVYRFMLHRCGDPDLAEDLMAEALLAAAHRYRDGEADAVTVPWIMGVARHKLLEHWRRSEREQVRLRILWGSREASLASWTEQASPERALGVLRRMAPIHQAVLALRYGDGEIVDVPQGQDGLMDRRHPAQHAQRPLRRCLLGP